jgi:hypothetical protein
VAGQVVVVEKSEEGLSQQKQKKKILKKLLQRFVLNANEQN